MPLRHIVGSLAGLAIVSCFVFGLIVTGNADANSTPLITTVVGMFGLFLMQLSQAATINKVDKKTDNILNGVMDRKIQENVHTVLDERESDEP